MRCSAHSCSAVHSCCHTLLFHLTTHTLMGLSSVIEVPGLKRVTIRAQLWLRISRELTKGDKVKSVLAKHWKSPSVIMFLCGLTGKGVVFPFFPFVSHSSFFSLSFFLSTLFSFSYSKYPLQLKVLFFLSFCPLSRFFSALRLSSRSQTKKCLRWQLCLDHLHQSPTTQRGAMMHEMP